MKRLIFVLTLMFCGLVTAPSFADSSGNRLAVGFGLIHLDNPSKTYVSIAGEYERRLDSFFGLGITADYLFSDPAIAMIGVPTFYLHPLAGDWFVSAAPVIQFGSKTYVGSRLGTRIPLPIGPVMLIPTGAVTFINGGKYYFLGLGISI